MKKENYMNKVINELIKENDIKTFSDFSEVINKLQGKMLQTLLEGELDCHLGYEKGSHEEKTDNRRNGYCKSKKVKTKQGSFEIKTPRCKCQSFL